MRPGGSAGFFGKLPGAGDFVQRRLPAEFVEGWDAHFQRAVAAARDALGSRWEQVYLHSPTWRFVLSPRVCGPLAWAGVVGPGRDRVSRHFPMVIARAVDPTPAALREALGEGGWFAAASRLLGEALASPSWDVEAFDTAVSALTSLPAEPVRVADWSQATHWRLPLPDVQDLAVPYLVETYDRANVKLDGCCLWWTAGGGAVAPTLAVTAGLPLPSAFAGFLDGASAASSWRTLGAFREAFAPVPSAPAPAVARVDALFLDAVPPRAAVRDVPAPARLPPVSERAECGLTVVAADAVGGDPQARAAAAVFDVIRRADADALSKGLYTLGPQLLALHGPLQEVAEDLVNPVQSDCTVVVAHAAAGVGRVLRIGRASAWIWRRGHMVAAFPDAALPSHPGSAQAADPLDSLLAPAPTSSGLGAPGSARFEVSQVPVQSGDRVLLACGVTLSAPAMAMLAEILAQGDCQRARQDAGRELSLPGDAADWPLAVVEIP